MGISFFKSYFDNKEVVNIMDILSSNIFFVFLFLCTLAFLCELIDSSIGMGYGTILSPLLIVLGFATFDSVPAILISQMVGGAIAARQHHVLGNAHFKRIHRQLQPDTERIFSFWKLWTRAVEFWNELSSDGKAVLIISTLGIFASLGASYIGTRIIDKKVLEVIIAIVVLVMALLISLDVKFEYTTRKMFLLGLVSAGFKGLSGGGFGPLVTAMQKVMGKGLGAAVGVTTFSEVLICLVAFFGHLFYGNIQRWDLVAALCIGSALAGSFGPRATLKLDQKKKLKTIIAFALTLLGTLVLLNATKVIHLNISV